MPSDVDAIIAAWHEQLEEARPLLELGKGHVEITLYANKGRVRRNPAVVYHGGPVEFVDPKDVMSPGPGT